MPFGAAYRQTASFALNPRRSVERVRGPKGQSARARYGVTVVR
jgi:hypothetical protein